MTPGLSDIWNNSKGFVVNSPLTILKILLVMTIAEFNDVGIQTTKTALQRIWKSTDCECPKLLFIKI
jgi:hypothetical protein